MFQNDMERRVRCDLLSIQNCRVASKPCLRASEFSLANQGQLIRKNRRAKRPAGREHL